MMLTEAKGYVHRFDRYFDDGGKTVDRLEQIIKFGILSERRARDEGISFKKSTDADRTVWGARNTDNVIFLFSPDSSSRLIVELQGVNVILAENLKVVSQEEMRRYQRNAWRTSYPLEVYRFGRIDPKFFREIILPTATGSEVEKVREMIDRVNPVLATSVVVKGGRS